NNLKSGPVRRSTEETADGVRAAVEQIRRQLPKATVVLIGIFPRQPTYGWIDGEICRANGHLEAIAARDEQAVYVDLGEQLRKEQGQPADRFFRGDNLHLTEAGYRLWAEAIGLEIRRALR
ncbi:MAG: SGNH/GDSL hydrolase family protein, partial [Planctomycetota bacterium]